MADKGLEDLAEGMYYILVTFPLRSVTFLLEIATAIAFGLGWRGIRKAL